MLVSIQENLLYNVKDIEYLNVIQLIPAGKYICLRLFHLVLKKEPGLISDILKATHYHS